MQVQSNVDVQPNLKSLIEKSVNSSDFLELESSLLTLLNEDNSNSGKRNFIGQWVHLQQVLPTKIQTLLLMFEFAINGNSWISTNCEGSIKSKILYFIVSLFFEVWKFLPLLRTHHPTCYRFTLSYRRTF